ncbi:MAG: T9SS type A sorting domain-containing protein [Bacteroidales bacterium]|nr:T9SS type A sorting domain-containing protein [Bacteroidales bacterium]
MSAQEILDVEPGTGTLNEAINTHKGDKVYRLQNGYNGYYVLSEIINNTGFELTIIGGGAPDADDPDPTRPPTLQSSGTGGAAFHLMFQAYENITLKDIYFMNATSDGVVNYHYFLQVDGNHVRIVIDNCVLDPASNVVYVTGGNASVFITNSLINKSTDQTTSVNGPVPFLFSNHEYGLDTLVLENNTLIGLSTALFHDSFAPVKTEFVWMNHNTFIHHKAQIKWMGNVEKFYFTNNLLYDCHVVPTRRISWAPNHWTGYPSGSYAELLMGYPRDSVKNDGVWVEWGFDNMTSFVANNIEFKNQQFIDNLDLLYNWTEEKGAVNTYFFAPLVWTPDVPERRGFDLDTALANSPLAKVYNNIEYPNWKAVSNKYDINPAWTDHRIDSLSAIFAEWVLPAIKNDYFTAYYDGGTDFTSLDWYWEPDGDAGKNEAWPLFDGSYTNDAALSFGLDGLPAGDLNWFPEMKAKYLENEQVIKDHILALNTTKIDLDNPSDIVWTFDYDVQGWHDLGAGRDVAASWDNGFLKMTYFENSPDQGPQLWFAAVQVEKDFDASKYPYIQITYNAVDWPTTSPVKVLITFANSNNEPVYAYADLDPTKTSVFIDIASVDPGWGKAYTGMMKSVQFELPHNGAPASNPATDWFAASTMIDKVVLTSNDLTTGIRSLPKESVSIYPNPASNSFNISGTDVDLISIYDLTGKLVKIEKNTARNISVEGLDKGLYLVKIDSRGVSTMKKLIVE